MLFRALAHLRILLFLDFLREDLVDRLLRPVYIELAVLVNLNDIVLLRLEVLAWVLTLLYVGEPA